ncbi:MAG: M28 family peptidase [Candidatus Hydrogenedentes bacterium]|nr:M28 family peptidase [Candidatus Hydrogenedentota bacterium]
MQATLASGVTRTLVLAAVLGCLRVLADAPPNVRTMLPQIHAEDIRRHVYYLASEELQGRLTGTEGEKLATSYVADVFKTLGLKPAGDNGDYFDSFEFTAGVSLGEGNALTLSAGKAQSTFAVDTDWRPLAFSKPGATEAGVVFAGYGIVAPTHEEQAEYDSYVHLDVQDKWVLVLRFIPESVPAPRRQHFNRYAGLRYKAMLARDRGAKGLLVVSGPNSKVSQPLVALNFDASFSGSSIAAISVTDTVADALLKRAGKSLKELQDALDTGDPVMGFPIPDAMLTANVAIQQERRTGRNVLGRLDPPSGKTESMVVVGAHIDHLGPDASTGSLARDDERERIHYGGDDNASGVAGVLEIAQWFVSTDIAERPSHSILFAAWSGEELGLLGSAHYTREFAEQLNADTISPAIRAYVNMDMIGRLRDSVVIGGIGSSSIWNDEIEAANKGGIVSVSTQDDSYLPTDATSFFVKGVPFINAFTGAHEDYHTPRDTAEKVNCEGAASVAQLMANITRSLANRAEPPDYIGQAKPQGSGTNTGLRATLGTIPDYGQSGVLGVLLAGVREGGPAAAAGVRGGDIIVELGGMKVENIYDYTYAIEALKIGESVTIAVTREGQRIELRITPAPRE